MLRGEMRRAQAYAEGVLDYDGLVNYASFLRLEAKREKEQQMQLLTKLLSNIRGGFADELSFGDITQQSVAWSTYQLFYRQVAGMAARFVTGDAPSLPPQLLRKQRLSLAFAGTWPAARWARSSRRG